MIDTTAFLIRRRARQALQDTAGVDPWEAEWAGPAVPRRRISRKNRALASSDHKFVKAGGRWRCSECGVISTAVGLESACKRPCRPPALATASSTTPNMAGVQIRRLCGEVRVGEHLVDPSHQMWAWDEMSLRFCMHCGFTGTIDGRHLAKPCPPAVQGVKRSKKGQQNLVRISKGRHPCPQGAPEAARAAL